MSPTATTSTCFPLPTMPCSSMARYTKRPMRPKPLIATRTVIFLLLITAYAGFYRRFDGITSCRRRPRIRAFAMRRLRCHQSCNDGCANCLRARSSRADLQQVGLGGRVLPRVDPTRGVKVLCIGAVIVEEEILGDAIGERFFGNLVPRVILAGAELHRFQLSERGVTGRGVLGAVPRGK